MPQNPEMSQACFLMTRYQHQALKKRLSSKSQPLQSMHHLSAFRVTEIRVTEIRVTEIRVTEIRGTEIRGTEIRVTER